MPPKMFFMGDDDSDSELELLSELLYKSMPKPGKPETGKPKVVKPNVMKPNVSYGPKPSPWLNNNPMWSRPNSQLVSKEVVANMFINEAVKQLIGVFGNSVLRLSHWLLDRSKSLAHHCGRCGRRAGKYCDIASAPAVGHSHRYRVCRKCCGCTNDPE
ncbi:hypothetical protein DdX_02586 [Ditylenchus destructor]|uniref:Uncharacterized protein n=1 Tax=Ditylenchus destructor TaxID=166010 RepID=A0AAD4ND16_9BILA|nr:hypothetical protein DdX_02586 [Ditylenchus destructor]